MGNDNSLNRKFMTRAVHSGESPDTVTGASAPNIVMSSTFVIDEPVSFSAQDMPDDAPYVYSRWDNPTVSVLQDKLAALEEAESCRCFASGMAATSALLLSTLSQGDRLVMSDSNYPGTAEFARKTLTRLGIEVILADLSDLESASQAITSGVRLVWVETPANPTLRLTDIRAVAELAHSVGAELAVDSTFATPVATRPLNLGADYVVHSLTKYCCGHGDAMGGAVPVSYTHLTLPTKA